MTFRHDVKKFWTGYDRMKRALEAIAALNGPTGRAGRSAAVDVLAGGAWPEGLPPEALSPVMDVFAGLDAAERAVGVSCVDGGDPGSPGDAKTDEGMLLELVREWTARFQAELGEMRPGSNDNG